MAHGLICKLLCQRFRGDEGIKAFYFYAGGFDFASVSARVEEALGEHCDVLVSLGLACALHIRTVLENAVNVPFHLAVGIDPDKVPVEMRSKYLADENFMLVAYTYLPELIYGTFLHSVAPVGGRIMIPYIAEDSPFESTIFKNIEADLASRGFEMCLVRGRDSFHLQSLVQEYFESCSIVLLPEGTPSQGMTPMCSYLAYEHEKTLFVGDTANVQNGLAALGYGGDITVLVDAAEQWIRFFEKNGFDAPRGDEPVVVDIPRVFAVNTSAARYQGLDPDHIEAVARAHGGEVYAELTGVEYPLPR